MEVSKRTSNYYEFIDKSGFSSSCYKGDHKHCHGKSTKRTKLPCTCDCHPPKTEKSKKDTL